VTTDRDDLDSGLTVDAMTVNRLAPFRQVVSVNGEEEDVENINIHDFTTFEQEQLIGSEFIGKLKRKSVTSEEDPERRLKRNLSSFRSAVRAVLTTEAIMQAMKHYNHRSDSETEEDEDESKSPLPTETKSRFVTANNPPDTPNTDTSVSEHPDGPDSQTSMQSLQNSDLPDICQDKPAVETDAAINFADSPPSAEKPDVLVSPMLSGSVSKDAGVDEPARQLAGTEADSSAADDVVPVAVNEAPESKLHVGLGPAEMPASETTNTLGTVPVDASDSKALLEDVDLSSPEEVTVTAAAVDVDDAETAKPTDGLLTATSDRRPTETADTGCRCCCVQ